MRTNLWLTNHTFTWVLISQGFLVIGPHLYGNYLTTSHSSSIIVTPHSHPSVWCLWRSLSYNTVVVMKNLLYHLVLIYNKRIWSPQTGRITRVGVCVCVLLLGGTHEDYCNQICNAFQRAATIHNQIHGIGTIEETHAIMVSNISSSITDRASVNAKTLKVLQQRWGTIITTTYCHLHPLETLSRNALSCLKAFDTVTYDKLYAGTSTADKLLLAIDKWRYSDSSGEPRTFLSFMKSRNISRGTWARTRGNRLHVKLRNAEVCVKYYTELKCYFTHHTTRDSVFKNTILEALSTDVATHQLTALAIFSLILSRPWMKKLYVAHGTDLTHVGAFKKVKTVIDNLKVFTKDQATFTIQDIDSDLFGEKLERNIMGGGIEDGDIWLAGPNTIPVSRMLFRILEGALSDLKQQYESYLSHSDEDLACLEAATVNTPVHNIAAEQEVGMVSAAKRRAPGATMIFLASTIKSTRNQTLRYPTKLNNCNRVSPHLRLFSLFNVYKNLYILSKWPNVPCLQKNMLWDNIDPPFWGV